MQSHHRSFSLIIKVLINGDVTRWPEKLCKYFFLVGEFKQKITLNLYKPEINFFFVLWAHDILQCYEYAQV